MTGPEHYREAERILAHAYDNTVTTHEGENPEAAREIAAAQVHATLALAAATALPTTRAQLLAEMKAWSDAAGTRGEDYDVTRSFA